MASNVKLEQSIDKVLNTSKTDLVSKLSESLSTTQKELDNSTSTFEQEYERIISDGNKEADKLKRQLLGSSDIKIRNKQLLLVQELIDKVFNQAIQKIKNTPRDDAYKSLLTTLLNECTKILGTSNIIISTNDKDVLLVKSMLPNKAELGDTIQCMGGIYAKSKDGPMTFDNTIDARLERMKPLIRKNIAKKFGIV